MKARAARNRFTHSFGAAASEYYSTLGVEWGSHLAAYSKDVFGTVRRIDRSRAPASLPADALFDSWSSILGSPPPESYDDQFYTASNAAWLESVPDDFEPFTLAELCEVRAALKRGRAPGEDLIPNELIIALTDDVLQALLPLFNDILSGRAPIPAAWKRSILVLLPKCPDPSPSDHRPISLLPRLFGMWELLLLRRIQRLGFVELVSVEQGGFRPGRSSIDQAFLLAIIDMHYRAKKKPVYAAFLDFRKAFDSVPHSAFIYKLIQKKLPAYFIKYVNSWLSGHSKIMAADPLKRPMSVERGGPQGSIIVPLLFSIFADDLIIDLRSAAPLLPLPGGLSLNSLLYADDSNLLAFCPSDLQALLDTCERWALKWGMTWVPSKCFGLTLGSGCKPCNVIFCGAPLQWTDLFKYLGIYFRSKQAPGGVMHMRDRFAKFEKRLKALAGWFAPRFRLSSVPAANLISRACLLPLLYYGCEIFPLPRETLKYVEGLGRKVLRAYFCDRGTDVLSFLGWPSPELEQQRRILVLASHLLGSPVRLLHKTARTVIAENKLAWAKRLHSAINSWKLADELQRALHSTQAAGHLRRQITRVWPSLCPAAHPSLVESPLSASYTFRFFRGHLDTKDKAPRTCPLCLSAPETASHLANCPSPLVNTLRSRLSPGEQIWLANPRLPLPAYTKHPSQKSLFVKNVSMIHRKLWELRMRTLSTAELSTTDRSLQR